MTATHTDHLIGILYLLTSVFFLLLAGLLGLLIRVQMFQSGGTILTDAGYNQIFSIHVLIMIFWFLSPFAFGFANYLVPLQIGADDPRVDLAEGTNARKLMEFLLTNSGVGYTPAE